MIEVPEIPSDIQKVLNNKKFCASDIKWIKTVNDNSTGNLCSSSAYLPPDPRVLEKEDGIFFFLELNGSGKSLDYVEIGDIILLFQKLEHQKLKCFTHLVTPIGDRVIQNPYKSKTWSGRWVKVIAMTGNRMKDSIPAIDADWINMGFKGDFEKLAIMKGSVRRLNPSYLDSNKHITDLQISSLQQKIWNKFEKWRKN